MVGERSATATAARDDDLAPEADQQPDRRFVDLRRKDLLRAARQQRYAHSTMVFRRKDLRTIG
jgi:hypothetical protein